VIARGDRTILAIAAIWIGINITSQWYPTPDGCGYLSIARGLAIRGVWSNLGSSQVYYPIGYPLLIAPTFLLSDEPFLEISLLHAFLALGLIGSVYSWVRQLVPAQAAWIALLAVGSASFGNLFRRTLSETLFMVLLYSCGMSLNRLVRDQRGWLRCAVLLVALILTRPAGATLALGFLAILFSQLLQRQIPIRLLLKLGSVVGPAAFVQLALIAWDRQQAATTGQATYTQQLRDPNRTLAEQVVEGTRLRIQEMGRVLLPGMYKSYAQAGQWLNPNMLIYLPLAGVVAWGWFRLVRAKPDVLLAMLPFYVGLHIVWPYDQATRFFTPLVPLLALCWTQFFPASREGWVRRVGLGLAILHLLVAAGHWLFSECPTNRELMQSVPHLRELIEAIPQSERDSVACSSRFQDEPIWLQFLLDRPVGMANPTQLFERTPGWVVLHPQDELPIGFSAQTFGPFRLLQRK
jgi:hypothetical protein